MRYILLLITFFCTPLLSDAAEQGAKKGPFASFTGKLVKDRVRMRLQPNLESHIFKELYRDDLVLVVGEDDDFYACQPPQNLKAYIFRTYVLDDIVEGNNVNVRLEPDISAPVVAQLNTGEHIVGQIAPQNNKWLQIELPKTVHFYVAKEFITKAGDATLFSAYQVREQETKQALKAIETSLNEELEKPFSEIQLSDIAAKLQEIAVQNKDFPHEVEKAQALMERMQRQYLVKSLEVNTPRNTSNTSRSQSIAVLESEQKVAAENQVQENIERQKSDSENSNNEWKQAEAQIIALAIENGTASSEKSFYENEMKHAKRLQGIVKANNRFIKNIPGDFVLINPKTNLPVAYLYSTKVCLQNHLNKEVLVVAVDRPNNHFAFPAFFVLEVHN